MKEKYEEIQGKFEHIVLDGSSYEIGQIQGNIFKKNSLDKMKKNRFPKFDFMTTANFNKEKSGFEDTEEILKIEDRYCPGIIEEMQGFADSLDVEITNLAIHYFPVFPQDQKKQNCTGLVFLPKITDNQHILVGRTYDWFYKEEDNRLCSTRVNRKYGHIGFSTLLFGRLEGINDKGLCIIMTAGGAWDTPVKNKKAIPFWLPLRGFLENYKTTNEVIDRITKIPIWTTTNFLITDPTGHVALVEGNDSEYAVKEITLESEENFLYSTNVYKLPKMIKHNQYNNPWLLNISKVRNEAIEQKIHEMRPKISNEFLRSFISTEIPEGLCAPWQSGFFGALWGMIFDVTECSVEICFGTPSYQSNQWQTFTPTGLHTTQDYEAIFLDKKG